MEFPSKIPEESPQLDFEKAFDSDSKEYENLWFTGTFMRADPLHSKYFYRLAHIHNRITKRETGTDNRFNANMEIARRLAEFFPLKWLHEITAIFKNAESSSKLIVKHHEDIILVYLGYIELLLIFRGLTLSDSTLQEISRSLSIEISRDQIRSTKMKLLKIFPLLKR